MEVFSKSVVVKYVGNFCVFLIFIIFYVEIMSVIFVIEYA